ncbi:hypothetical protein F5Y07DRAFT_401207 [Xylaria sp. FL0933]|nr:hypothetical protein F5Y07DRAFT_401207 [Xylaria sp. FL0933]
MFATATSSRSAGSGGHDVDLVCEMESMSCTVQVVRGDVMNADDEAQAVDGTVVRLKGQYRCCVVISRARSSTPRAVPYGTGPPSAAMEPGKVEGARGMDSVRSIRLRVRAGDALRSADSSTLIRSDVRLATYHNARDINARATWTNKGLTTLLASLMENSARIGVRRDHGCAHD